MAIVNINIDSQFILITRADLQALITATELVEKGMYVITDAVTSKRIAVMAISNSSIILRPPRLYLIGPRNGVIPKSSSSDHLPVEYPGSDLAPQIMQVNCPSRSNSKS
jgi:hypothetical protein